MEQSTHPSQQSSSLYLSEKLHDLLDESDTEEETRNLHFQEEMVEEVMQELYKEIITASSSQSCGASVSDKGSSLMAGIEVVGVAGGVFPVPENGSEVVGEERNDELLFEFGVSDEENNNNNSKNNGNKEMEELFEGLDKDLDDDEWLGRILGWDHQN